MSTILERSDFNNYFIQKNCIEYFFYLLSYKLSEENVDP